MVMLLVAMLSLSVGEVPIKITHLLHFLQDPSSTEYAVLSYIRIPRTLLAIGIGGGLSLSGVILQGIYRNPLVEPYTLGISGGASLGITFTIVSGMYTVSYLALPASGFLGAFATVFFVYGLSRLRGAVSINRMLLIGVMTSFICSSAVMFLMSITAVENIHGIVFWIMGSLNESDSHLIYLMIFLSVAILAASYLFVVPLNALRAGEVKARHLGINTSRTISFLFLLTSLLTGACIAVGGVIGFVGLTIPHVTRFWAGTDYRILLVASFLSGGIFLMLCDILARTIISPNELPIGVITGIVGGITFIVLLSREKLTKTAN